MFGALCSPSVDALTATNLSKLSSTKIRIASERESMELRRCDTPAAKSWYVAFGCTTDKNVFGSKDFDVRRMAAPAQSQLRISQRHVRCRRTGFHVHVSHTVVEKVLGSTVSIMDAWTHSTDAPRLRGSPSPSTLPLGPASCPASESSWSTSSHFLVSNLLSV
jgi:hypothetical protein